MICIIIYTVNNTIYIEEITMSKELTPFENWLRVVNGEMPEYVPINSPFGGGGDHKPFTSMTGPSFLNTFRGPQGGTDFWGVKYITNKETNYAAIPAPYDFLLTDIRKWRDVIKKPDFSDVDWEQQARKDKEEAAQRMPYDPTCQLLVASGFNDLFQQFIGMMGFTEGLCAINEEPEEVSELLDFMNENAIYLTQHILDYYKPQALYILDDSASRLCPFMSPEVFEEMFVPRYKKTLQMAVDRGMPVFYHNCGKCQDFLKPMVDIGVKVWDPAQTENDFPWIKETLGRRLAINGGYEYKMPPEWPNVKEDDVRESVKKAFDMLAPGGGFIFSGHVQTLDFKDPDVIKVNGWIMDEGKKLAHMYY